MALTIEQLLQAISQQNQNPSLSGIDVFELGDESTNIEDWLKQFCFALDCSAPNLKDEQKVKLLMTKLSKMAFSEYKKSCLPKDVTDYNFAKTEEQLKALFAKPQSVWIDRYECLRASKSEDENFRSFINRHKRLLRDFEFKKLNEEQFYCLMLLTALKNPKDGELKIACRKCSKVGHLEAQCNQHQAWLARQGKMQSRKQGNLKLGGVLINSVNQPKRLSECPIKMNGNSVEFALDSGAEVVVINEDTHEGIGKTKLSPCNVEAKYHDGTKCTLLGKGEAEFEFGGIIRKGQFYVAKRGSLNLFGIEMLDTFGLMDDVRKKVAMTLNVNNVKKEGSVVDETLIRLRAKFPTVFSTDLGHCKKAKARLSLMADAKPVYCRPRPVPYNTKLVVEAELDRLLAANVIRPVDHTRWAAPIVVVKKATGSARVCADFSTDLNNVLLSNQHPLPVPEDIFATLNGGQIFSQIDFRDAYHQIELEEGSKELCTIATHRGNFEYQRLPFGVKSAPGIFQSIMDSMLADCPFAIAYLDDVIVVSRTRKEHWTHLVEVFKRIDNFGFRIKPEKCSFGKERIKFLGFIIDKDGRRPDATKIEAIRRMPIPTNVSTLRSFLGMVNHYQQFVKNLRFIRQPLDDLLKQDTVWNWSNECQKAFDQVIGTLQSDQLLTHYDPSQEIIVSADASEHGIGAVISHRYADGSIKAIAHASHSLAPAERNYAQIEKEGLALIFAVQKFHKYLYGRHFILQTDHKPLLSIFGNKKEIKSCTANRLQRWALILLAYDFDIEYQNTTEFGQADVLSRLISKTPTEEDEVIVANLINVETEFLNAVVKQFPLNSDQIIDEIGKDEVLNKVVKYLRTQWPTSKNMSSEIILFHRRREALSIENGCIIYADRVVIPTSLQKEVLQQLHQGHPGMKRMKNLARQYVYWFGLPLAPTVVEDPDRPAEVQLPMRANTPEPLNDGPIDEEVPRTPEGRPKRNRRPPQRFSPG